MGKYGTENQHGAIRNSIVNEVVKNWDDYVETLDATSVEFNYKNTLNYKIVMGRCGTFGTDFEVAVFCRLYRQTVKVFNLITLDPPENRSTRMPGRKKITQ